MFMSAPSLGEDLSGSPKRVSRGPPDPPLPRPKKALSNIQEPSALNLMLQLLFLMPAVRVEHSREREVCTLARATPRGGSKKNIKEEEVKEEGTFATQVCWRFVSISDWSSSGAL
ncbi:hypothetical protein [Sinorhizobium meliloti]|uniref:hypothetical protein n=1 Tax=Rhizobium meliloti TaxID=382 RepID=UPI0020C04325|nr:hypothetical protein [Sinorhizobium meliloti]